MPAASPRRRASGTTGKGDAGGFVSAAEYARRLKEEREGRGARSTDADDADPADAQRDEADPERRTEASVSPPPSTDPPTPAKVEMRPFPDTLDKRVRNAVEATGIHTLYPPQAEAMEAVLADENVLVSIPTASGKSLVAHMAILHHLVRRGGKALFIVPLRALASEKYEELRELSLHVPEPRLKVGIATGDLDERDERLARFDIIVTTSEKADSLIRHAAGWIDEVAVVVADEVHLLGDSGRGPTLEVTLARLMARGEEVRLVALSATVGNAQEIARWLKARLVTSTWRPVALKEGVYHDGHIQFADGTARSVPGKADKVVRLVEDTAATGAQALVFVNTRRSTEATALKVAKGLKGRLEAPRAKVLEEAARRVEDEDGESSRLGQRLAEAVRGGVAFHHAGLASAQRRIVEDLFRQRHLFGIVATPTLAAGVNLPARRVIIRDIRRYEAEKGNVPLSVMEIKQMTGRAGRPRYDPFGEAVIVARSEDEMDQVFATYLFGEPEAVSSSLGRESALRTHLLAGIATGLTHDRDAVDAFIESTFLAHDPSYGGRWSIRSKVDDTLAFLADNDFISAQEDGTLRATRFGERTSQLYVDPMSALTIRDGLTFTNRVPQVDDLALLALVASTPDVPPLWLKKNDEWVEEVATEHEGRWLREPFGDAHEKEHFLSDLKTALLLRDWISEHRIEQLEAKYGLGPGDIQNRVTIAEWLLYAAEEVARLDRSDAMKQLVDLKRRVHHGVKAELLPILDLPGIGRYRARVLVQAGFRSKAKIQRAAVTRLLALPGFGPRIVQGLLKALDREADLGEIKRAEREVRARRDTKEAEATAGADTKETSGSEATAKGKGKGNGKGKDKGKSTGKSKGKSKHRGAKAQDEARESGEDETAEAHEAADAGPDHGDAAAPSEQTRLFSFGEGSDGDTE